MINQTTAFYCTLGYVLLFIVGVVAVGLLRIKSRKERPPVPFKLLRGPGESLRKRIAKSDEWDLLIIIQVALAPFFPAYGFLWLLAKVAPTTSLKVGLGATAVVFLIGVFFAAKYVLVRFNRYRADWLGYMGERMVGETLMELCRRGYYVFHDVPAEGAKKPFNLDHVVVGPTGLWLVETKTRRKGRARPGYKDHEVTFDGTKLIWPWGEDRQYLDQVQSEARWLTKEINQATGLNVTTKPILALPGWYVREKALGEVRVLNHKNLCSAITGRGQVALSPDQIDLIVRQLDQRCRDVED